MKLEESRNRQDRMRQHVCEVQQSNDDLQAKLQVMQRRLQEATAECQLLHQRVAELHSHSCVSIWLCACLVLPCMGATIVLKYVHCHSDCLRYTDAFSASLKIVTLVTIANCT